MKKPLKIIALLISIPIAVILLITITYYSFLFVIHDFSGDFLKIDSCLDDGGRWNYDDRNCER